MAEPTSSAVTTAATYGAVALTAALPGVNGEALIGAFAGAALFAVQAKDLTIRQRAIYMLISILIGYCTEDEVMRWTSIQDSVLAAFIASAFVVTAALAVIDRLKTLDITSIWRRGP